MFVFKCFAFPFPEHAKPPRIGGGNLICTGGAIGKGNIIIIINNNLTIIIIFVDTMVIMRMNLSSNLRENVFILKVSLPNLPGQLSTRLAGRFGRHKNVPPSINQKHVPPSIDGKKTNSPLPSIGRAMVSIARKSPFLL